MGATKAALILMKNSHFDRTLQYDFKKKIFIFPSPDLLLNLTNLSCPAPSFRLHDKLNLTSATFQAFPLFLLMSFIDGPLEDCIDSGNFLVVTVKVRKTGATFL